VYEKYTDAFLNSGKSTENETYQTLFGKLEEYDKFILDWTNENLDEFIKFLKSISVNSVNKYLQFIREFHKFIGEKEGIEYKKLVLQHDLKYYIDFNKLLEVTITETQYKILRRLLVVDAGGITYNFRDAAILVCAWNLMDNADIKNLMKDDIKFFELAGKEKCEIRLKNRYVIIEDEEEINIIKKTLKEDRHFVGSTDKRKEHDLDLKSSPAFIRPAATRQSASETVANPSEILRKALMKVETIPGTNIDLYSLAIEDVVRSKLISLLRQKNINTEDIKNIMKKSSSCSLYWISEVATILSRKEIKGS
jgi:hypothetical protein